MKVSISASDLRPKEIVGAQITENLRVETCGAIQVEVMGTKSQFFPSSFYFQWAGLRIYIDPVETSFSEVEEEGADFVFITHEHEDHYSPEDLLRLCGKKTQVVVPKRLAKKAKKLLPQSTIVSMSPGDVRSMEALTIQAVASYTTEPLFLWFKSHPKSHGNLGYHLSLGDFRIFHPGDTAFVPQHLSIPGAELLFLPLDDDGGKLTMGVEEALKLAGALKPQQVIPMHYELGSSSLEALIQGLSGEAKIITLDGKGKN